MCFSLIFWHKTEKKSRKVILLHERWTYKGNEIGSRKLKWFTVINKSDKISPHSWKNSECVWCFCCSEGRRVLAENMCKGRQVRRRSHKKYCRGKKNYFSLMISSWDSIFLSRLMTLKLLFYLWSDRFYYRQFMHYEKI
jgi:hypothetical protein